VENGGSIVATYFSEIGGQAGVDFNHFRGPHLMSIGAGSVIFDLNNDGWQDIFVSNEEGSNSLYLNNGDLTFTDIAVFAGVDDPSSSSNGGCSADYDRDGDRDLFATTWGSSKLFQNNGDNTFTDVTAFAGVGDPDNTYRTLGCAWGDYNQDGLIDLIMVRHLHEIQGTGLALDFVNSPRPFFLNGDGTFTNVTSLYLYDPDELPVPGDPNTSPIRRPGFQPGFVDYDNDGDPDMYACNDFGFEIGPNVLWRNDGAGGPGWIWTDFSMDSNSDVGIYCMGLAVGDYDNDGWFDMYVTNFADGVLLKNNQDGTFTDETVFAGVGRGFLENGKPSVTWGDMFFDYDNNGLLDLYVIAGNLDANPNFSRIQPNAFFENNGDGTFTDNSKFSGIDDEDYGRGGAYADFNNDGCLDVYLVNIGHQGNTPGVARLYLNPCHYDNNWIIIKATGTTSNLDGIGARITATTPSGNQIREVGVGWSHQSQHMLPVHFGLEDATLVDIQIEMVIK
jgi:hypothetical protein